MSIGPKKKISKSKSRSRHSMRKRVQLKKLSQKYQTTKCAQCGANKLNHRVCPSCGFYKNKQIITIKTNSKETVVDA